MVFPKYRAVIFANGCFWHRHDCHLFKWPGTRKDFWRKKITANAERDVKNEAALLEDGWRVGRIWECALKGKAKQPLDNVLDGCANWLTGNNNTLDIRGNE